MAKRRFKEDVRKRRLNLIMNGIIVALIVAIVYAVTFY